MSGNSSNSAFGFATQLDGESYYNHGLTKREYFAAMAMQGMLSNSIVLKERHINLFDLERISENAILFADRILHELEKPQP